MGKGLQTVIDRGEIRENEKWVFVSTADGDLKDREATRNIFKTYNPTHVIHLAAKVSE